MRYAEEAEHALITTLAIHFDGKQRIKFPGETAFVWVAACGIN
jgi:hypothetical protein